MKRLNLLLLFLLLSYGAIAQQHKAVLPYEMIGGKMIVEIELNGTLTRAIFDTGAAKNTITKRLMNELGLAITSTQQVTDVNSNKSAYNTTVIDKIHLPKSGITFTGFSALVLDENLFNCFGVEALLGSEMLAKTIVTIDDKAKTLTITSAEKEAPVSLRLQRSFVKGGYMPIFPVDVENNTIETLFDTGYGGFFLLKDEDYNKYAPDFNVVAESLSEGSFGLSGQAAASLSKRVLMKKVGVNGARFLDCYVETSSSPYSLLGAKILKYGKVTIDYPRARLYFEPYEKEVTMQKPLNDFHLMVQDGKLKVTTVWSSHKDGLSNGDVVTHINGKAAPEFDFCKSIIEGIAELKTKKKSVLTVKTKDGVKKINYFKNK